MTKYVLIDLVYVYLRSCTRDGLSCGMFSAPEAEIGNRQSKMATEASHISELWV